MTDPVNLTVTPLVPDLTVTRTNGDILITQAEIDYTLTEAISAGLVTVSVEDPTQVIVDHARGVAVRMRFRAEGSKTYEEAT